MAVTSGKLKQPDKQEMTKCEASAVRWLNHYSTLPMEAAIRGPTVNYGDCPEWNRLFSLYIAAVYELLSVEVGDVPDRTRTVAESPFEYEHRSALAKKDRAKQELIEHIRSHINCAGETAS